MGNYDKYKAWLKDNCKRGWNQDAWDHRANPPTWGTCGGRVNWLIENYDYSLERAMNQVRNEPFDPYCAAQVPWSYNKSTCKFTCWGLLVDGENCKKFIHKDGRDNYVFH